MFRYRVIAVLLAGMAGLTVLGAVLVVLPGVVVDHDLAGASIAPQDRLQAVNDVRTTLLRAVGGMVVLFGAYATWRQLRVSQDGLRAPQEGYVTDRFSTAVDQLGNDKLETRIGGLHALWRIAEHSARHHPHPHPEHRRKCSGCTDGRVLSAVPDVGAVSRAVGG
jgi:ABC-type nickel/cobalt efflux system permease component RcnA